MEWPGQANLILRFRVRNVIAPEAMAGSMPATIQPNHPGQSDNMPAPADGPMAVTPLRVAIAFGGRPARPV